MATLVCGSETLKISYLSRITSKIDRLEMWYHKRVRSISVESQ